MKWYSATSSGAEPARLPLGNSFPRLTYSSSNPGAIAVDPATGQLTAISPGVATISATAPNVTCAGQATVIGAPSEVYEGTYNEQLSIRIPLPQGFTPNPLVVTGATNTTPIQLAFVQSLQNPGFFSGLLIEGPGQTTFTIPAQTCPNCTPPITTPGGTNVTPFPELAQIITGTGDGRLFLSPVEGFPPVNISVSPGGQVSIGWTVLQPDQFGNMFDILRVGNLTRINAPR